MLCFRCEHRAKFLETKTIRPRHECGLETTIMGCYMFKPVQPIVIKPREKDDRPLSLNLLSCRVEKVEEKLEFKLELKQTKCGILPYWVLK